MSGRNDLSALLKLCVSEKNCCSGWWLEFDRNRVDVVGQDLFKKPSAALQGEGLVAMEALVELEKNGQIGAHVEARHRLLGRVQNLSIR
ncbi:MAG: hypothetical protein ACT4P0_11725 [Panacagrimonas sp.]